MTVGALCCLPEDDVIRMIVEFLKKVGDQWEEEVRTSTPGAPTSLLHPAPLGLFLLLLGLSTLLPRAGATLQDRDLTQFPP